ncbi:hypothetical protein MKW98_020203 [Papaver atlanticum]|uniref:Uncharacterized protein n=1 Tax=Papaver atlanticum TaxID=357466 RepID=A0AAD4XAM2_9MAGN|nr:hypothetical protein MKW98_020203 [Papaver atlanticum]
MKTQEEDFIRSFKAWVFLKAETSASVVSNHKPKSADFLEEAEFNNNFIGSSCNVEELFRSSPTFHPPLVRESSPSTLHSHHQYYHQDVFTRRKIVKDTSADHPQKDKCLKGSVHVPHICSSRCGSFARKLLKHKHRRPRLVHKGSRHSPGSFLQTDWEILLQGFENAVASSFTHVSDLTPSASTFYSSAAISPSTASPDKNRNYGSLVVVVDGVGT